jgi:hypothetical protein
MIQDEISSDINVLNELNKKYIWIPNENTIRPTQSDLVRKYFLNNTIQTEWKSMKDFIQNSVFKKPYLIDENNKKYVENQNYVEEWLFEPSMFRYNIIPKSKHYILWNNKHNFFENYDSKKINQILKVVIFDKLGHHNYDFAWYKNPKPTVPEFYHIQVFWIDLNTCEIVNSI